MEPPELCTICGGVPIDDETILQTAKYYYRKHGDCSCNDEPSISRRTPDQIADQWENLGKDNADPMESPSEGFATDYRREIHSYLVEKGEREE